MELWRTLHGLVFDHLIHVALWHCILNGVESDLHLIGRHVLIQHDPDTNAANLQLGNWIVLSTRIVQTWSQGKATATETATARIPKTVYREIL